MFSLIEAISEIRIRLPGKVKHRVTFLMNKKLLKNLAIKGDCAGIQIILNFEFNRVINIVWKGVAEASTIPKAGLR